VRPGTGNREPGTGNRGWATVALPFRGTGTPARHHGPRGSGAGAARGGGAHRARDPAERAREEHLLRSGVGRAAWAGESYGGAASSAACGARSDACATELRRCQVPSRPAVGPCPPIRPTTGLAWKLSRLAPAHPRAEPVPGDGIGPSGSPSVRLTTPSAGTATARRITGPCRATAGPHGATPATPPTPRLRPSRSGVLPDWVAAQVAGRYPASSARTSATPARSSGSTCGRSGRPP